MNVYQIALPVFSNDGRVNYARARAVWQDEALRLAGGYTEIGRRVGAWRDPSDGAVYREPMEWYEVATDDAFTFGILVERAFELFPDQLSFYTAQVGAAQIINRAETAALVTEGGQ